MKFTLVVALALCTAISAEAALITWPYDAINNIMNRTVTGTQNAIDIIIDKMNRKFECIPTIGDISSQTNDNLNVIIECLQETAQNTSDAAAPIFNELRYAVGSTANSTFKALDELMTCYKTFYPLSCISYTLTEVQNTFSNIFTTAYKNFNELPQIYQRYLIKTSMCVAQATDSNRQQAVQLQMEFIKCFT